MYLKLCAFIVVSIALFARVDGKLAPLTSSTKKLALMRGGRTSALEDLCSLDWRYFAAGGICAAFSHGITTPIDVVKTRMQTEPEKYNHGVLHAAKEIVSQEGVGYLLAGLGPTVVGYGLEGALKFGFYETFKSVFSNTTPYQFVNYLLASVVAGAVASIVLCPMEEARIKMVGDAAWAKENVVSSILRLVKEDGLLASFGGLPAMLSKQIPYTMGKQVSFDLIAQLLYVVAAHMAITKADAKLGISVGAAFLASIVACISSQPGDMILTATYKGNRGDSKSFGAIVAGIYRQHGLRGFYLGLQARLAHVAAIITSQLVVYDMIKMALGLPVTGSH